MANSVLWSRSRLPEKIGYCYVIAAIIAAAVKGVLVKQIHCENRTS